MEPRPENEMHEVPDYSGVNWFNSDTWGPAQWREFAEQYPKGTPAHPFTRDQAIAKARRAELGDRITLLVGFVVLGLLIYFFGAGSGTNIIQH